MKLFRRGNYHPDFRAAKPKPAQGLDWLYAIPVPLRSEEDLIRSQNLDLEDLSWFELRRELERLYHRLLWDESPPRWLLDVRLPELERRVKHGR